MKVDIKIVIVSVIIAFTFGIMLGTHDSATTLSSTTVSNSDAAHHLQSAAATQHHTNNNNKREKECPLCSPPSPPCPKVPKVPKKNEQEKNNEQVAASQQRTPLSCPTASITTTNSAAKSITNDQPFIKELNDDHFLEKLADPKSPTSIIRGGLPKCLTGLSYTNKNGIDSFHHQHQQQESVVYDNPSNCRNFREGTDMTFAELGHQIGADKVALHRYEFGYDSYIGFPCLRKQSRKIKILEIGLGCLEVGHSAGPRSVALWGKLMPNAQFTAMEYDATCASDWNTHPEKRNQGPTSYFTIYQGDQSNMTRWKEVMEQEALNVKAAGLGDGSPPMYDIIVDDGGHRMWQQVNSFLALWPHVKPGGIYVIEDLQTNWMEPWGGTTSVFGTSSGRYSKNLIKHLTERVHAVVNRTSSSGRVGAAGHHDDDDDSTTSIMMVPDDQHESGIFRVDCTHFMCVFVKRWRVNDTTSRSNP